MADQQQDPVDATSAPPIPLAPPAEPAPELPGFLGQIAAILQQVPRDRLALIFALSFAVTTILPHVGDFGLYDCWETHYGEVAREMVVRNDYLYPYWKDAYFFSKPVLLMWMMAVGFNLAGATHRVGPLPPLTELGARGGVALIAIFCVVAAYLALSRIFNRRAGVLGAAVMATTPFYLMVGRQAITDMPFTGLSSAALCFFMISMFSERYQASRWYQRVSPWVLGFFALVTLPQYWAIISGVVWLRPYPFVARIIVFAISALLIAGVVFWQYRRGRDSALIMFYILVALATLAKGLGGFLLPGLVIFLYLVVTWDWALLRRVQIFTGGLLFVLIAFPWYVVLSLFTGKDDEQKMFFQRFWIHDHLNRLAQGVHGEKGPFSYFIKQLGFGTLTWAAIMPVALFEAMRVPLSGQRRPEERARVFLVIWAVTMFVFFTAMQTKFHHYILPAVPPLAMLAGLWLSQIWDSGKVPSGLLVTCIFAFTMLVAADGIREPWSFIDLFTYHYISYEPDYYFPRNFHYAGWIAGLTALGLGLTLCVVLYGYRDELTSRSRSQEMLPYISKKWWMRWGLFLGLNFFVLLLKVFATLASWLLQALAEIGKGITRLAGGTAGRGFVLSFVTTGFMLGIYMSQVYMLELGPHWSQRYFYDTYWNDRQANEPNLAYLMNWRGETFYALNTDQQIKNASDLQARLKGPGRKYIIVESKRYKGLEGTLSSMKDKLEIIDRSSSKWYLVRVNE